MRPLQPFISRVLSRIERDQEGIGPALRIWIIAVLAAGAAAVIFWLASRDPLYRTVFVEEFQSNEAGRAAYLFGTLHGEGGNFQSVVAEPLGNLLSWGSYSLFGFGLYQLRLPFLLLSVLSLAIFGTAVRREASGHALLGGLVFAAFVLSPFLLNLRATSVVETMYVPILGAALLIAGRIEMAKGTRHSDWFALACVSGLAVFVKQEGFIVPLAALAVAVLEWLRGRLSRGAALAFAAGGLVVAAAYVATVVSIAGVNGVLAYIDNFNATMALSKIKAGSMAEALARAVVNGPKNLDLYFPGLSLVSVLVLAAGFLHRDALSLPGRMSLAIVIIFILGLPFLPVVYWKRFLIAGPALLFAALSVYVAWQRTGGTRVGPLGQRILSVSLAISILVAGFAWASPFAGMWQTRPFWDGGPASWLSIACAAGAALWVLYSNRVGPRHLYVCLLGAALVTTTFGLYEVTKKRQDEMPRIGRAVAAEIDGKTIVSDHNTFRFVGYFTNAHFRFVPENDPGYPSDIVSQARALKADYIGVTNTYSNLEALVNQALPEYRKVAEYTYVHPKSFERLPKTKHVIVLYRRIDEPQSTPSAPAASPAPDIQN